MLLPGMNSMSTIQNNLAALEENPYQSPMYGGHNANSRKKVEYHSAKEAFAAGLRRGAKFGAKWMGIILGSLTFILCLFVGVRLILFVCRQGYDYRYIMDALMILGRFILFTLVTTFGTSLISAFMMGVAEWHSHWRSGRKAKRPAVNL
jgi:hypothetical protein